mmetsp:Transcript_52347/g.146015  ORF Transcript_52347/g.146015 Transcript_52347/m.146015 type:complete len:224 (+) Transcript_52347:1360-2031(+)
MRQSLLHFHRKGVVLVVRPERQFQRWRRQVVESPAPQGGIQRDRRGTGRGLEGHRIWCEYMGEVESPLAVPKASRQCRAADLYVEQYLVGRLLGEVANDEIVGDHREVALGDLLCRPDRFRDVLHAADDMEDPGLSLRVGDRVRLTGVVPRRTLAHPALGRLAWRGDKAELLGKLAHEFHRATGSGATLESELHERHRVQQTNGHVPGVLHVSRKPVHQHARA